MVAQAVRLTDIDIDNALKNKDFDVIFQPIYQLDDGSLLRLEAFVRWTHPGLGVLPPGAFISFFETQGRMSELTRYVFETALNDYIAWRGTAGPGFSVNLAFSDITDKTFPAYLKKQFKKHDFPPEFVTLECPCPPTSDEMLASQKAYDALRKVGCQLAIEVRGRTNETLRTLSPFPFNEVKTGGSAILRFARTVRGGPGMTAISELLELAKEHDARTIAVGVEDQASLSALNSLGFSAAQGNHLTGVAHLADFDTKSIDHVRKCLNLDPIIDADTLSQQSDQLQQANTAPDHEAQATDISGQDDSEKIALEEKRRLALIAAKKRALKKAAQTKILEKKAALKLAEQKRKEEAAAAKVEKNARKLQDRLNKAFDIPGMDDDPLPQDVLDLKSAAETTPQTDANPANIDGQDTALDDQAVETSTTQEINTKKTEAIEPMAEQINETSPIEAPDQNDLDTPQRASDVLSNEERERLGLDAEETVSPREIAAMNTQTPQIPSEKGVGKDVTPDPFAHLSSIRSSVHLNATSVEEHTIPPAPVAPLSRIARATMMAGSITDSSFNPHAPRPDTAPSTPVMTTQSSPQSDIVPAVEDLPEEDIVSTLSTEDEVHDEAFQATDILNPEEIIEEQEADYTEEQSTVEAAIAARLAQPRTYAPAPKSFLARKHIIYSGYFWPRSWRQAMARRRNHAHYTDSTYDD